MFEGHLNAFFTLVARPHRAGGLFSGKRVLRAAHGNSLRTLVKHLDVVSEADIVVPNIPTGEPLVYELDEDLKPIRHYYLGNAERVQKVMQAVANQTSLKD